MTLEAFERIVLRLANQTPTRYWKHWSYPTEKPWMMAVEVFMDRHRDNRLIDVLAAEGLKPIDFCARWTRFAVERDFPLASAARIL